MSEKYLTSWERRTRRRIWVMISVIIIIVAGLGAFAYYKLMAPYETWDMAQFYNIEYSGYNNKGTAEIIMNNALLDEKIEQLRSDYNTDIIHLNEVNDEDYERLRDSITVTLSSYEELSNGTTLLSAVSFDTYLANKLRVKIENIADPVIVKGLPDVTVLSAEDLFKEVKINFEGVSPNVTMTIENTSTDPFMQSITYAPVFSPSLDGTYTGYSNGETVTIRAAFDADEALKMHYAVDTPSEECQKDYIVNSGFNYVSDLNELTDYFIEEAVNAGLNAFTDANEYGVRIFCEAGLVPVYVNKQATFEWLKPSKRSVYFRTVLPSHAGESGMHYNELDVIYNVKITQANGVTCSCYAVVRFSDIVISDDGTLVYDFAEPKIVSSDYKISNIEKTVITMYDGTHIVTKVE